MKQDDGSAWRIDTMRCCSKCKAYKSLSTFNYGEHICFDCIDSSDTSVRELIANTFAIGDHVEAVVYGRKDNQAILAKGQILEIEHSQCLKEKIFTVRIKTKTGVSDVKLPSSICKKQTIIS